MDAFLFDWSKKPDPMGAIWGDKYPPSEISRDWPLTDVRYALIISILYLVVIYALVKFMENRKAYDLFYFRVFHNAFLVILSGYMTIGIIYEAVKNQYSLFCNDKISVEADTPMASLIWIFYVSKVYEFMDTVIMALRKKNNQITVLHLYHHFSIFLVWWLNLYYFPQGDAYFAPAYNAFVHVLMYSYYLLTSYNIPCPWKSFITKFQIGQFIFFVIQGAYEVFVPGCMDILELSLINFFYAISLLALFLDFYRKAYLTPRRKTNNKKKA